MKRFFFSLIALSAVAVGCTQSAMLETPDLGGTEISFSPYTGRTPVTKATSIIGATGTPENGVSLANAGGFKVYAFAGSKTLLNDVNVQYGATGWTYTPAIFWPDKASSTTLSFVAYSANSSEHFVNANGEATTASTIGFTFKVPTDIADQVDLLATAYQPNKSLKNTPSGSIQLKFHHLLSRVGFKVQTTQNKMVTINSITLNGKMYSQGTLNFKLAQDDQVPTLSGEQKQIQTYNYVTNASIDNASGSAKPVRNDNHYLMIMPHTVMQGDDHTIVVDYSIGSGLPKTSTIELPVGFEFNAGMAYEFLLNISTSAITFEVSEEPWGDPSEDDNPIPIEPTTQNDVELGGISTETNRATVSIVVNKEGFDEVGVAFRGPNGNIVRSKADGVELRSYEVVCAPLDSYTEYSYWAYSKTGTSYTDYPDETFTTAANITLDTIDFDNSTDNPDDVTYNSATVTGRCEDEGIEEYGFCLIKGSGTPTEMDIIWTASDTNSSFFTHTITDLEPLTDYTCSAYVKMDNGEYYYSVPQTFKTKFAVDEADYAGGGFDNNATYTF